MKELKSGIKSSESWKTITALIAGIAMLWGVDPEQIDNIAAAVAAVAKSLAGLVLAIAPLIRYIESRMVLKKVQLQSSE